MYLDPKIDSYYCKTIAELLQLRQKKIVYHKLSVNLGLCFKDICTGKFLTSAEKRRPIPEHWNADKVPTLYAVSVPPWWDMTDMAAVFASFTKNKDFAIDRVRFSVGEIRTATWRVSGESIGQLAGMVFHGVRGSETVSLLAEIDYIAKKAQVSEAIQSRPRVGAPLMTPRKWMMPWLWLPRFEVHYQS